MNQEQLLPSCGLHGSHRGAAGPAGVQTAGGDWGGCFRRDHVDGGCST